MDKTNHFFRSVTILARRHKITSTFFVLVLVGLSYWGYTKYTDTSGLTKYIVANVAKETIISSVTGSGQVSASDQIDMKTKASGDIIYLGVAAGQEISAGKLIAQVDSTDAQKSVRDAEVNLETAKLSYDKLTQPVDKLSLMQSENNLAKATEAKASAEDSLKKSYDDAFTVVSNTFLDLPGVMSGLQDIMYSNAGLDNTNRWGIDFYEGGAGQYDDKASTYRNSVDDKYKVARDSYDKNFSDYKSMSRLADTAAIENLVNETYDTTKNIADYVKASADLIQFYKDKLAEHNLKPIAAVETQLTSLNTYTGKTNSDLSNLLSAKNSIDNYKNSIVSAQRSIDENTQSLSNLKDGPDSLDLRSSTLSVQQKENSLADAKSKLSDYYLYAPFSGTIAKVSVRNNDSVSSGTVIATLISRKKQAELSLNEVDAAKIKVGQKATLTFDAIDGLSMVGEVSEVDAIGTVSQGVVSYGVKVAFDAEDARIKPGMSVSASIITDVKNDVLAVPNSAVKSRSDGYYVEVFSTPLQEDLTNTASQGITSLIAPAQKTVEIGVSNDSVTEIKSGLVEGEQVVSRTITSTTVTTQSAPSLFGGGGRNIGR
ncbi:MAG: efflux RND transporter periplasmic adaptor subunit [Candidatus Paceibacterota bacterium]|jgi:RND family efflux transporter MFP subunit